MIVIHICLASLVLIIVYFYVKYKKNFNLINQIPGPPAQPIIGNFFLLNGSPDKLWNVVRKTNNCYYPITRYWFGPIPLVGVRHPDDLEIILSSSKHIEKGFVYKCLNPWLKTGLLTSTGEKWHSRRKILTPAFHFQILKKYLYVSDANTKKFIEVLRKDDTETVQDLVPLCANYTLNIICEAAMGVSLDEIDTDTAKKYKKAVFDMGEIIVYRFIRPFIRDWMFNFPSKMRRMQTSVIKTLHGFTCMVLEQRRQNYKDFDNEYFSNLSDATHEIDSEISCTSSKRRLAMLDLLLKAEEDGFIDTDGIKEELDTFIFAGHDTTAMALVFIIMLLAEHEEIQEKARREIMDTFNKYKDDVNLKIQELPYLERCIKESLRLYPPVHSIVRRLEEDTNLRGFSIPAGTEIGCFIFDVHRDPTFWPKPTIYDPDRFLPENTRGRHPYAYIPFSAGPRNCIGQKFAMMELKCLVAHILFNFKLEPVTLLSDIRITLDMITRPLRPVYTKFVKINNVS